MSLVGQQIGPYQILAELGRGGMGEVYRARDTRLNRDVAIKVLPDAFAADAERMARFSREAQTLAALNHANIATIFGIEQNAIVMELVEGEDLSALIAASAPRGVGIDDSLRIARQIIEALEAAHDIGIVHRDLKPANIKVRDDGSVKVLDFGLAKTDADGAASGGGNTANSPTLTARATQMGVILGTAAYMSPEQARGRTVDKRTDVWAFGCVLYELLSGRKAFDGEDATEIISAVVKTEPDWKALPASVPANVRAVVTRCLVKDRKTRIPDLSVVRYLLDEGSAAEPPAAAQASRKSSRWWPAATVFLALTTAAAATAWYVASSATPAVTRFMVSPPDGYSFTAGTRPGSSAAAVSPDGSMVAFTAQDSSGKRQLWVRRLDTTTAQAIAGTDNAANPFWSPDSRFVAYSTQGRLWKVGVGGGPPSPICALNSGITSRGGSWNADGVVIFNNGPAALYRAPASGGDATIMGALRAAETGRQYPSFLPDGRHFLYHTSGSEDKAGIYVGSLDSPDGTRVVASATGALYDNVTGRLLFVRQGTLVGQPFDLGGFSLSGEPTPVAERVEAAAFPGVVSFSISTNGVLAYGTGEAAGSGLQMMWLNRKGALVSTVGPVADYRGISLSPDGSLVAAHRHDGDGGDIWVTDINRNVTTRLTTDAAQENSSPAFSPDGDRVAYASTRNGNRGIYVKPIDGSGTETMLFESRTAASNVMPFGWSADGAQVLFQMPGEKTRADLWAVNVNGDHTAYTLVQTPFGENHGQFSPDGKWLAYSSTETDTTEIYVKPVGPNAIKWLVSNNGGNAPRWRGDSKELYYIGGGPAGKMMAVGIAVKGTTVVPGPPTPLFDYPGIANMGHASLFSYAVTRDGERFLVSGARNILDLTTSPPIVVVLNWREALRK